MVNNKNYTNSNVKFLREKKGISQTKLSKDLHIDTSTIAKWENGTRQITLEWAIKLANYFDISVGDFISVNQPNFSSTTKVEKYKEILKEKGLMDEDVTEDDVKKLIDFAIANKDFIIKKDKEQN